IDPGSTNLGFLDEEGNPGGYAYMNGYRDIWRMMGMMRELGLGASVAVYEPGFLRTTLSLHRLGLLPQGSFIKLYFRGEHFFGAEGGLSFGLPPTETALLAYLEMLDGSSLPWCVSAGGADVLRTPVARRGLELGGHLHVGLEFHFDPERTPTNVELVEEAAALAGEVGRPVASAAETREILDVVESAPITS